MPATTPNRLYPYPLGGDPTDVPGDLQRLAEAIDDDVCALQNGLTGRPVARFRGTGPYVSESTARANVNAPATPYEDRIPFNVTDFNTANVIMTSPDVGQRLIFPDDPGFYFALVTLYVPVFTIAGATVNYMGLQVRRGDFTNPTSLVPAPRLAGSSHNVPVDAFDRNVRVMSLGLACFMNGTTDAFSVEFRADTTPNTSGYEIGERTITILKMTQS
ncbi:MAG TPA: hypothetical protein VJM50_18200 [Pyrinomonadaceae bacterium]|nr:hypothetical protein [Pyrinomonadaceae bacterium]